MKQTEYQEGISLKHVIASAAVPKNFAYEEIDGHKFWDGGIVSNTPIRELISEHSIFWKEKLGLILIRIKSRKMDKL